MKISPPQLLLGCCCAFTLLIGCMPMTGPGGQPIGPNYPGGSPWYRVGYPRIPGAPGRPIVTNPAPGFPVVIIPETPDTPPTIPVTDPTRPIDPPIDPPNDPADDPHKFWSPWPLPPRGQELAVRSVAYQAQSRGGRSTSPRSVFLKTSGSNVRQQQLLDGATATPSEDLKYRGGRIIRDLYYVNLYVSGDTEWSTADVEQIDGSLSAAMRDEHLNNVLLQYYENQSIRSTPLPSHPLIGYTPAVVSRGDIQNYATYLFQQGLLEPYDLANTVFNFLLPPGTRLTDAAAAANSQSSNTASRANASEAESDDGDSAAGMAGYHGSVEIANGSKVYFAVSVYSERFSSGVTNGIPVFSESWKNVTATLYHQLIETRTNPDVEDALRYSSDLNADRNLGWVSDSGLEIGDFPIRADLPLSSVIVEVPLADGRGRVPVQLPYSNFVHGPEGPIAQPHPLPAR